VSQSGLSSMHPSEVRMIARCLIAGCAATTGTCPDMIRFINREYRRFGVAIRVAKLKVE